MKSSGVSPSWKTLPAARNGARFFVCVVFSSYFPSFSILSLSLSHTIRVRSRVSLSLASVLSRRYHAILPRTLSLARSLALSLPRSLSGLQPCIPCCVITRIYHFLMA